MSQASRIAPLEQADSLTADAVANEEIALSAEAQAAVDAEHATTGWSAYDVWRTRVFVPSGTGYNKPRGNS